MLYITDISVNVEPRFSPCEGREGDFWDGNFATANIVLKGEHKEIVKFYQGGQDIALRGIRGGDYKLTPVSEDKEVVEKNVYIHIGDINTYLRKRTDEWLQDVKLDG